MMNKKFKNKAITKQLINKYKIKIKINSIYHSMNNEMIEKKHRLIMNVLSKMIENKIKF